MVEIGARALEYLQEKVNPKEEHYVATFLVPQFRKLVGLTTEQQNMTKVWTQEMCAAVNR